MSKVNCSVTDCSNSTYKLNKYKKQPSNEHNLETKNNCKKKGVCLKCKPPFRLHTFHGPIKCKQLREA